MTSLGWLRRQAVGWSLPRHVGTLEGTLAGMEFVQADPIQAPARAQDLILAHRVRGYRAGDLERHYSTLDLDEDTLYAYGFVARRLRPFLHPRRDRRAVDGTFALTDRAADVLAFVGERGVTHPREVQAHFGHERATNDWGGTSSATTLALERLRHYGLLRIADRVAGVRRYEVAPPLGDPLDPEQRLRELALVVARTLAPAPEAGLSPAISLSRSRRMHRRASAFWRPSTRWSGTGDASPSSGVGSTASRPIRRWPSGCWATTRCRCCGGTR